MKKLTIGLLGTAVNNENMGCVALTYSLISQLSEIAKRNNLIFEYIIFEPCYNDQTVSFQKLKSYFDSNISMGRMYFKNISNCYNVIKTLLKIPQNKKVIENIKKCNLCIDLTQGDSFSDIYGEERFYSWSLMKLLIERSGVPLVLGPQTYGPFKDSKVKQIAKDIIDNAYLVVSRDEDSIKLINSFCNKSVVSGTDLAFALPYNKTHLDNGKINIGINISGLLSKNKTDQSNLSTGELKTNFSEYINRLINFLVNKNEYIVHIISHVGNEGEEFARSNKIIYSGKFDSPIDAKSYISGMDIFIGARMHATIAAFTCGVATIPLAYSKKFAGVYSAIGYNKVIDLMSHDTDYSIFMTEKYINNFLELKSENLHCLNLAKNKYNYMIKSIEATILEINSRINVYENK